MSARYLQSLRHVSASCRLSESEERRLVSDAMAFEEMRIVVCKAAEQYDQAALKEWSRYVPETGIAKIVICIWFSLEWIKVRLQQLA